MSEIRARLVEDMKTSMKNKDKNRLSTIRMALAAFKQKEVDERVEVTEDDVISILTKMIKQRKDSAEQFKRAGREELAQKELDEIEILQVYLPKPLSEDEIIEIIQRAILEVGASSVKDMGKIMSVIKAELNGRADMGKVGSMIKSQLS
ncbi:MULTISPECIES: GatB/YqeY domain-containing protein [Cysteiniphilum]|uniref:Aspartyl-tRNA amidotransferase subunit B n=1 Tax=Cysteiniphilum litorale TaxID=2056700 RepID=A0A8J3E984_9GAMM|nr:MULTISPECIES: GatB/YqeY domain-containing protein [Cysteiniphilum]MDA0910485.1 GatB/YqeY domain-containing protein [Pseudomonadota bacterium]WHN64949.1 GatB/YqeY domain-containing protein [Cysteiniphilum sp. QT6929]GGF99404.1 aspartyl-tRNA amidotransferase subunit B [Cysteiniphilum litorale]